MREITFCGDRLTKQGQRDLLHAYKAMGVKRFHYCNAGELDYTTYNWFVSYYTYIIGYRKTKIAGTIYMHISPYVFLKSRYIDSRTTKKQTNRWLRENGFDFSMQYLETVYLNALNNVPSLPLMHGDDFVLPRFNNNQLYVGEYGVRNEDVIDKVPFLKYNEDKSTLICVGERFDNGNTTYTKYFR